MNFLFKFEKCEFYTIKIKFLKFTIKLNDIYIFKKKIKAIKF